jgi:hypothetical protein
MTMKCVIEVDEAFFRESFKGNLITELICIGLNGVEVTMCN